MNQRLIEKTSLALLIIKMLLVIPFGVLLSTLVLYTTHQLKFADSTATNVIASFIAYAGIARIVGGYLGNRFFSYHFLLCLSAITLGLGCILIVIPKTFYLGVTAATIGSGLTVAVNCLLTDIFQSDYRKREAAFLWNYSGMNIGYLVSFSLSGYFELYNQYHLLFTLSALAAVISLIVIINNYSNFHSFNRKDRTANQLMLNLYGWMLILLLFVSLYFILRQEIASRYLIITLFVIVNGYFAFYGMTERDEEIRTKIFSYLILSIPTLLFWTIYNLSPMALTLFIERNVNRQFLGFIVAPQWAQLIITMTVVVGGPLFTLLFEFLRRRGFTIYTSMQFSTSLILVGISMLVLSLGIQLADNHGLTNFNWIVACFVIQGIAELLLAPIGFAVVGQFAPPKLRGLMMGNWLMLIGMGATLSGYVSDKIFTKDNMINPLITNVSYSYAFTLLSVSAIGIGVVTLIFLPVILKRINHRPQDLKINEITV